MPIHDVGYRPWDGKRTSQMARFWIITSTGIRLAAKSKWVRRMLFFAWLPVLYWGIGFFIIEQTISDGPGVASLVMMQRGVDERNQELARLVEQKLDESDLKKTEGKFSRENIRAIVEKAQTEIQKASAEARKKEQARRRRGNRRNGRKGAAPNAPPVPNDEVVSEQSKAPLADDRETDDEPSPPSSAPNIENEKSLLSDEVKEVIKDEAFNARQIMVAQAVREQFSMIPNVDELADSLERGDTAQTRSIVWSWLMMTFFRYPQALLILFLVGSIAPSLISRDLRSRAFLLYFSRPIGRLEYTFGKLGIPIAFIVFVTTLPALALYAFAVALSPDLSVFWSTWDIPFRVIAATATLVIPTASLALMLSSLTHESRFASFAWFAIWALGHGAWAAVLFAAAIQIGEAPFHPDVLNSSLAKNWSVLSLYNNLGAIQSWIFGFGEFKNVWRGILALAMLTIFSQIILFRRVSAPIRI